MPKFEEKDTKDLLYDPLIPIDLSPYQPAATRMTLSGIVSSVIIIIIFFQMKINKYMYDKKYTNN